MTAMQPWCVQTQQPPGSCWQRWQQQGQLLSSGCVATLTPAVPRASFRPQVGGWVHACCCCATAAGCA